MCELIVEDSQLLRESQSFARTPDAVVTRLHMAIERERRFFSDATHELCMPLAEISAAAEVAARMFGDAQAAFAVTLEVVERMRRATDTLQLLSRCEAGYFAPALDPLDLPALLDTLLDAHALLAARRGIVFERVYDAGTQVRSDAGTLERIVSNLLRNAIAYAPEGSHVDVRVQAAGEGGFALSVSNLAPDLTQDDLPHLVERFWRKSSSSTAMHPGLGLVLASALAHSLGLHMDFSLTEGRLSARVTGLAGV
jgi:two-component system sensor histidine kinase QseC